jgi:hypothetical protein
MHSIVRRATLLVLIVFAPLPLAAQSLNATLSGIVRDSSGGVLPGVTVTARQTATNQTRETTTDTNGRYTFPDLAIGPQEITAMLQGFQQARSNVQLTVGQSSEVNITLNVGAVSESIEVSASAIGIETRSSTFGTLVTREQIENQPLNGRDFSQLILLQPGAVQARSATATCSPARAPKFRSMARGPIRTPTCSTAPTSWTRSAGRRPARRDW